MAGWSVLGRWGSQGRGAVTSELFGKKLAAAFALLPVVDKELQRLEASLWSTTYPELPLISSVQMALLLVAVVIVALIWTVGAKRLP